MQQLWLTIAVEPHGDRYRAGVYRGVAVTSPDAALAVSVRDSKSAAIDAALDLARVDISDQLAAAYDAPRSAPATIPAPEHPQAIHGEFSTVPRPTPYG